MEAEEVAARLRARFPDDFLGVDPLNGAMGKFRFKSTAVVPVLTEMRDGLGFNHLSSVGGVDWVDHREVVYVVWSDAAKRYAILSTDVPADHPHLETITGIWPSANWHEREAWEFVGISFDHHPDLRHLLMPDGYQFNPLLRSFKLHEPEELEVKVRHV